MSERPLRCSSCGHTDFFVVSNGVNYRGGTIVETYRWPERGDEIDDRSEIEDALNLHVHEHGYHVDQELLREPEIDSVDGPVKAFCAACLTDMTDLYMQLGREQTLPV